MIEKLCKMRPRYLAVAAIRVYQTYVSPLLLQACRFTPSCSRYTATAIEKYGFFKGGLMGAMRVLRCNPFSKGGFDPVR